MEGHRETRSGLKKIITLPENNNKQTNPKKLPLIHFITTSRLSHLLFYNQRSRRMGLSSAFVFLWASQDSCGSSRRGTLWGGGDDIDEGLLLLLRSLECLERGLSLRLSDRDRFLLLSFLFFLSFLLDLDLDLDLDPDLDLDLDLECLCELFFS